MAERVKRKSVLTEKLFFVMVGIMEEATVIQLLRKRTEASSQTAIAKDIGVSVQYINDVLKGHRVPSEKILKYLGLKREIVKVK